MISSFRNLFMGMSFVLGCLSSVFIAASIVGALPAPESKKKKEDKKSAAIRERFLMEKYGGRWWDKVKKGRSQKLNKNNFFKKEERSKSTIAYKK